MEWRSYRGAHKDHYRLILGRNELISDERARDWATVSRNWDPGMRSGLSPIQVTIGRSNVMETVESCVMNQGEQMGREMISAPEQLKLIAESRDMAIKTDAQNVTNTGLQGPLRIAASETPQPDDTVGIFQKGSKKRNQDGIAAIEPSDSQVGMWRSGE